MVSIIEEGQKPYDPASQVAGPLIMPTFAEPMTNISFRQALTGIFRARTPNSIFIMDSIRQAGIWRFMRFWAWPLDPLDKTKSMLALLAHNNTLMKQLIDMQVIDKNAVKESKLIVLDKLEGLDVNKAFQLYL